MDQSGWHLKPSRLESSPRWVQATVGGSKEGVPLERRSQRHSREQRREMPPREAHPSVHILFNGIDLIAARVNVGPADEICYLGYKRGKDGLRNGNWKWEQNFLFQTLDVVYSVGGLV